MKTARSFIIFIACVTLIAALAQSASATDPSIEFTFNGDHGEGCDIKVIVNNTAGQALVVNNVTVVLVFPYDLGGMFDPNVTYSVFLGSYQILPGDEHEFSKKGSMPDWDTPGLTVVAYVNLTIGSGDPQTFISSSTVQPLDSSSDDGISFGNGWVWLIPPGLFLFSMLGFFIQYYADKPYWDMWVSEKYDDRRSNIFLKWRWFVYKWMDDGKGTIVIAIWIFFSLIPALISFIMISNFA